MILSKKKKDGAAGEPGKEESRYIRIVRTVFNVCRRQCIPLYSSKFSRKDFTQWQHIALIVLMQRVRKSYREYVDDYLTTTQGLLRVLGLTKIPHFSTLEKFLLRVPGALLERVIGGFIDLTRVRDQVLAADSSGFSSYHASNYYALRIRKDVLSSMKKQIEQKEKKERR